MILYVLIAAAVVCVFLSAYFSASEMAYSACNKIRLENDAEDGSKRSRLAFNIAQNYDDALSTILIGNNIVNIAASSIASLIFILIFGSARLNWVSTLTITVLVIIFGETIPKIVAKKSSNILAVRYAPSMRVLMGFFKPFTFVVVGLVKLLTRGIKDENDGEQAETVEELQSIIETAEDEGVLDSDRTQLVQAAIDFAEISVSEIMTARVDVTAIDIDDTWEEILKTINESTFTRIPVYRDSIDNIIGVLHLNHFFKAAVDDPHPDLASLLIPCCYVYKTMKLPRVLSELRSAQQHLAVVCDEYSGTLGVVTMEDILEQLVGDIWDENDVVEEEVVKRNDRELEIDGDMQLTEFLELAGIPEEDFEAESETVGGWFVEMTDSFPQPGDYFEYEGIKLTVLEMDGRRVEKVLVKLPEHKPQAS